MEEQQAGQPLLKQNQLGLRKTDQVPEPEGLPPPRDEVASEEAGDALSDDPEGVPT